MSDELKERNILKSILIVRFACATLDVGQPIYCIRRRIHLFSNHKFDLGMYMYVLLLTVYDNISELI
jgi:hypothetical protein